jgi:YcaO-like protein with predicted kinase domain
MADALRLIDLNDQAGCPVLISAAMLEPRPYGQMRVVSGWGFSRDEAHRRCRMEAAERAAAIYRPNTATERFSFSTAAVEAIDPRRLVLLSSRQYETRHRWNRLHARDHHWPAPLDPQRPLDWLVARSLVDGRKVRVPAAHVLLGYPDPLEQGFPVPDSSGLAAHHDRERACAHALLELIERDAVAIWWYNQLERPSIPVAALPAQVGIFADWAGSRGRRCWILDLSSDLGVPVAAAITSSQSSDDLSLGFGAGWTHGEAALSAVGELAQFEASKRLRRGGDAGGPDLVALAGRLTIAQARWLAPKGEVNPRGGDPRSLAELLAELARANLEAFAVTLAQEPVTVVRAIVPGLRPIWPRFAPGRLFDVPVRTGERPAPLAEAGLNPNPIIY